MISIHALREEGDLMKLNIRYDSEKFLSTPSARRATVPDCWEVQSDETFLSTPSARRATILR